MNKDLVRMLAIAAALFAAMGAAAFLYIQQRDAAKLAEAEAIAKAEADRFERPHSRSLGPDDAPVTLVEFFDPECESCRAVHGGVKALLERYPESVRLVLRYMPLHGNSKYAATALEAAGEQGQYFTFLDTLYHYQPIWGSHRDPRPELIPVYADELGLDMERFKKALENPAYMRRVEIDQEDGKALGVKGTPSFFVNGKPLLRLDFKELVGMIESELGR